MPAIAQILALFVCAVSWLQAQVRMLVNCVHSAIQGTAACDAAIPLDARPRAVACNAAEGGIAADAETADIQPSAAAAATATACEADAALCGINPTAAFTHRKGACVSLMSTDHH